jgi:hypothetical protein
MVKLMRGFCRSYGQADLPENITERFTTRLIGNELGGTAQGVRAYITLLPDKTDVEDLKIRCILLGTLI